MVVAHVTGAVGVGARTAAGADGAGSLERRW